MNKISDSVMGLVTLLLILFTALLYPVAALIVTRARAIGLIGRAR